MILRFNAKIIPSFCLPSGSDLNLYCSHLPSISGTYEIETTLASSPPIQLGPYVPTPIQYNLLQSPYLI